MPEQHPDYNQEMSSTELENAKLTVAIEYAGVTLLGTTLGLGMTSHMLESAHQSDLPETMLYGMGVGTIAWASNAVIKHARSLQARYRDHTN